MKYYVAQNCKKISPLFESIVEACDWADREFKLNKIESKMLWDTLEYNFYSLEILHKEVSKK